jgi:capsular polysaccharide biosynthesis protein
MDGHQFPTPNATGGLDMERAEVGSVLDFSSVITAIRRQTKSVFLGLGVGAAAALVFALTATPTYRATATLFVGGTIPGAGPLVGLQQAYVAPTVVPAYAELARTRSVALETARRAGVAPADVLGHVATDVDAGVQILRLRAEASAAGKSARIANALAQTVTARVDSLGTVESGALPLQVVDPAAAPAEPASPHVAFSVLLGGLSGLLAGIGVALAFDRTTRRRAPTPEARARMRARRRAAAARLSRLPAQQ